jgi:hypothetical protein
VITQGRFVYLHIFHFATVLQIQTASDNSALNADGIVIILPPVINNFPGVNDIAEPVLIQAFIAKSSVKALNKSVLRWLARLD